VPTLGTVTVAWRDLRGRARPRPVRGPGTLAATLTLGVIAHLIGGGAPISCLTVSVAGVLGLPATRLAQWLAGDPLRSAGSVLATLGAGQLAMHLALSLPSVPEPSASRIGVTVAMLVAHALVAALLWVCVLGAERSLAAAADLLEWLRAWVLPARGSGPVADRRRAPLDEHRPPARNGATDSRVRRRRGPPAPAVLA
jgi:hypothetical protein